MSSTFWRGKKVFLTGHTGFKGSWMCEWLLSMGAKVYGYSLPPPTNPSLFEILNLQDRIESHTEADVRDLDHLKRSLSASAADIVIHMAAQPLVRDSYKDPMGTFAINIMGTAHLLEAIRGTPSVRSVVIVTTDKVYENPEHNTAFRENESLGGFDPYSSSKAGAEIVTAAMRSSFFHPRDFEKHRVAIASARAGNVIGGGDWAVDRLIPDAVRSAKANAVLSIRNPGAVRPWQHVLEPLSGYLLLAEKLYTEGVQWAEAWNFGPEIEDCQSVEQVLEQYREYWGKGFSWKKENEVNQPHEAQFLRLNCDKAKDRLHWHPRWHLGRALEKTAHWYKAYVQQSEDLKKLTVQQIQEFERCSL